MKSFPAIKKNDMVKIISGIYKGKIAKVLFVDKKANTVLLEGTNRKKKHIRPNQQNPKGGIIEIEAPLAVSKVMFVCPKCQKTSRSLKRKKIESGYSVRVCRRCGEIVDKV